MRKDETSGRMGHAADRRWRSPDVSTIRLNPVELANPAFIEDPAFGRTATGAYGGRGPRVEEGHDLVGRIASGEGRWVRTGGCGVRWVQQPSENGADEIGFLWRCVTVNEEATSADEERPEPKRSGPFSYLENGDGTVALVAYDGGNSQVIVPGSVDGMPVSVVGASLFAGHDEIEHISIPEPIRVIDEHAFDGCSSLGVVELPNTLESIGMLAFAKSGLPSLRMPASVKRIGEKAFYHCKRLGVADLPESLVEIGDFAFAYSGLQRVFVPASVEHLGFNAFDLTPAQKHVAEGAIQIDANNALYRLDGAGLYRGDALVELIGDVRDYEVAPGTRRIADGACKRHPTLARVHLPEGLVEVGDDAFRSNRSLRVVDLPESLTHIGARAFVDTSISHLHLSRNVVSIGENALLVQGEAQMSARNPLSHIALDPENPVYYLCNGLLCERDTSPGGGDTCLLYIGPDAVVRIPNQVTCVAVMAFGGAVGIDELYVHDHVHSFCYGWLSMKEPIRIVHVDFGESVDGYTHGDFPLPNLSTRFRYMTDLFTSRDGKTVFDFDYYDAWVTCSSSVSELAPAVYERMLHPMGMSEHSRNVYEGIFERKGPRICRYFAERSNIDALEMLVERGWINLEDVDSELDAAMRDGRPQATACLLEIKHRYAPARSGGLDFSL